jgi:tetratricopeptide (TPR) repeat protein
MAFRAAAPLALFAGGQAVYGAARNPRNGRRRPPNPAEQETGMKFNRSALALLAATAGLATASPAFAQYGAAAPAPKVTTPPAAGQAPAKEEPKFNISSQARKEIVALQAAVNGKNTAAIPAALAAAQAKARTNDDKYVIAQLQLKAAVDANDTAAMTTAIDAVLASGAAPQGTVVALYNNLGKLHYNAKAFDKAATAFDHVLALDANNVEALVLMAETRNSQGRTADGIGMLQKAIGIRTAAGQKPEESWYKRAVALAYNAKLPLATTLSREWVAAYPSPKNWRDAIRIYQTNSGLDDAALIDSMRLAYAANALVGENDYFRFANTLVAKGYPGEAKAVLDQGFAAKSIDKSKATFAQLYAIAVQKSQGDRASLGASATAAKAAADAKKAMTTADAYYGYGDFAQAADLYRAALGKGGVDKDVANLRLGMALARSGDKAGATAALNAVGGAQAEVARMWLTYLATAA